jgi:hypothetical protein
MIAHESSCPRAKHLSQPSTSFFVAVGKKNVDARDKRGQDGLELVPLA